MRRLFVFRVARWLTTSLLAVVSALSARADSGEFRASLTLLSHFPDGTHPALLVTDAGATSGSSTLAVRMDGRTTGTIATSLGSLPVTGTLRTRGTVLSLVLRSTSSPRVTYRGLWNGSGFSGRLSDRARRLGGNGTLTVDLSGAPALQVEIFVAIRNGVGGVRPGFGTATSGAQTTSLAASSRVRPTSTRIRATGGGFLFDARGVLAGDFQVSTFRCTAFGVSIAGAGGSLGHTPNPPDVTLLLVSGHNGLCCASDSNPYLSDPGRAGPAIRSAIEATGRSVQTGSYVDHYFGTAHGPGYDDLVADMEAVRDANVTGRAFPTRVVVVCHSHGGVRAHQAIHGVPDLPVRLLVDLDTSSCSFNVGHVNEPTPDPVSRWDVGGRVRDDEDVVWSNVEFNLEVRSGALCAGSILFELYDDATNLRSDGTTRGMFLLETHTSHSEVHDAAGSTVPAVITWILQRL